MYYVGRRFDHEQVLETQVRDDVRLNKPTQLVVLERVFAVQEAVRAPHLARVESKRCVVLHGQPDCHVLTIQMTIENDVPLV